MDSYATVDDYTARFGSAGDEGILEECLKACSAVMSEELARAGVEIDPSDEGMAYRLMDVCRAMAHRIAPDVLSVPVGVTQASIGAGGYTQSYSFSTFYGVARMMTSEKRLLGIPTASIGFARMGGSDG